jgi:hypothetical protein
MTLKIERIATDQGTTIKVIGKFRSEHISELKAQIVRGKSPPALDLEDASIVDVDVVRFFNACEDTGSSGPVWKPGRSRCRSGSGFEDRNPHSTICGRKQIHTRSMN